MEHFLKKFGGDEDLAIRNIQGLLECAHRLESQEKPFAMMFCRFHNVHARESFDVVIQNFLVNVVNDYNKSVAEFYLPDEVNPKRKKKRQTWPTRVLRNRDDIEDL